MAEVFVKHSLNSQKAVKFNLALREFVVPSSEGDRLWLLEIGTTTLDSNGDPIPPTYLNTVNEENIEAAINDAISNMCTLIDWTEFGDDNEAPSIDYFIPQGQDVNIDSVVEFKVKENLPSSGIDLSEMKVTLNNGAVDFDITSELEISGDPYEYTVRWHPIVKR